jgi:hypothetical protein
VERARLVLRAIEHATREKGGLPTRAEVVSALRGRRYQGVAYSRPVEWDAKGDNTAAVIFVNVVEGDRAQMDAGAAPPRAARLEELPLDPRSPTVAPGKSATCTVDLDEHGRGRRQPDRISCLLRKFLPRALQETEFWPSWLPVSFLRCLTLCIPNCFIRYRGSRSSTP